MWKFREIRSSNFWVDNYLGWPGTLSRGRGCSARRRLVFIRGNSTAPGGLYTRLRYAFFYFSPLGKPADLAIYFACFNFFFFTMSKAISVSTRTIFTIFHQMEGIWVNFLIQSSFSDSSRDVAMATNFVAKLPTSLALITLAFRNGMG